MKKISKNWPKKKKKLEVLNDYSKVTKYKVNIPKSTGFLFSSNNQFELEK